MDLQMRNRKVWSEALIHRVLLTEPAEWPNLTFSGQPRLLHTPSFEEFSQDVVSSNNNNGRTNGSSSSSSIISSISISNVNSMQPPLHAVKMAYRDYLLTELIQCNFSKLKPLQQLLLELHQNIRSLVPNRSDLHSFLNDQEVLQTQVSADAAATADAKTTSMPDLLARVIRAGQGLQQLESEARSESTEAWILLAKQHEAKENISMAVLSRFVITSLLYLLYKCELCQTDKDDFYLSHLWAPRIHQEGIELERKAFSSRYGNLALPDTAPRTRQWIHELVSNEIAKSGIQAIFKLGNSPTATTTKRDLIRIGWIDNTLFRRPDQPPLEIPEVLALDVDRLRKIRQVTRFAAAGSALALHVSQITGAASSVLQAPAQTYTSLAMRQHSLIQAIQASSLSTAAYENAVLEQVQGLALECNASLAADSKESLTSRTLAVLRGHDPVLQLLDQRMKQIFGQLIVLHEFPVVRSGRISSTTTPLSANRSSGNWSVFVSQARQKFSDRGLGLYASHLAMAVKMARKVIDLAWTVYEDVLDQMIQQACEEKLREQQLTLIQTQVSS